MLPIKSDAPKYITLTDPYIDSLGRQLQLWHTNTGLFGTVVQGQKLDIIPATHIHNPANANEASDTLTVRLCLSSQKKWALAYDAQAATLTIWPHLRAAGGDEFGNTAPRERRGLGGDRIAMMSEAKVIEMIERKGYKLVESNSGPVHVTAKNTWVHPRKGHHIHIDRDKKCIYLSRNPNTQGARPTHGHNQDQLRYYKKELAKEVKEGKLTQQQADAKHKARSEEMLKALPDRIEAYERQRQNWKFSYGLDHHGARIKGFNPPDPKNPDTKQFGQKLGQQKLTDSYKSANPTNPINAKGSTGGSIGGVACGVEYLEGLFDSPASHLEKFHYFYFPQEPGEGLPFDDEDLRQILRELKNGIYNEKTVPFFSLHFNNRHESEKQCFDLFPIIHPAYANTLVGRMLGLLDHGMKAILNGATFNQAFIDNWFRQTEWKGRTQEIYPLVIKFAEYCKEHLKPGMPAYKSLRELHFLLVKANVNPLTGNSLVEQEEEPEILQNFQGFSNSFRIIAELDEVQKEGPLLKVNGDFQVLYTINPTPEYKAALEEYQLRHGHTAPSYKKMILAYEEMCKRIHDQMSVLPLFRNYFAMLKLVNFFSSYFMTLNEHGKVPILPPMARDLSKTCPPLFPHLPIHTMRHLDVEAIVSEFKTANRQALRSYLISSAEADREKLLKSLKEIFVQKLMGLSIDIKSRAEEIVSQLDLDNRVERLLDEVLASPQKEELGALIPSICLGSEIMQWEMLEGVRIFGGCGLHLKQMKVQPLPQGDAFLDREADALVALKSETWSKVQLGPNDQGALFCLGIEDVPEWVEDPSEWMGESFITHPRFEVRKGLEAALYAGDKAAFAQLAEKADLEMLVDFEGRTLLHHAAALEDTYFLTFLLKRKLKADTEDRSGYRPIHYAAMGGSVEAMHILHGHSRESIDAQSHQGTTPLVVAIQHDQVDAVQFCLSKCRRMPATVDSHTPLHWALYQGHPRVIECILTQMSTYYLDKMLEVETQALGNPFLLACELDDPQLLETLLEMGAVSKPRKDGMTPIEVAIRRKCLPVLEFLLKREKPSTSAYAAAAEVGTPAILDRLTEGKREMHLVNFRTHMDETFLHLSIRMGNTAVAIRWIEKNRSVAYCEKMDDAGRTAIQLAAERNQWRVVEALIKAGVSFDFSDLITTQYSPILDGIAQTLTFTPKQLQDYLLRAARKGNIDLIREVLLPRGADPLTICGPRGWKFQHYMAACDGVWLLKRYLGEDPRMVLAKDNGKTLASIAAGRGSELVLRFLQSKGIKPEPVVPAKKSEKEPLHIAAGGDSAGFEKVLKQNPLEIHTCDDGGRTPLFHAIMRQRIENVRLLIAQGANLEHEDANRVTPLLLSASIGAFAILKLLVEAGVDLNKKGTSSEATPLLACMQEGYSSMAHYLLIQGANGSIPDASQQTPAHLAAAAGDLVTLRLLRERGAALNEKNKDEKTPALLALHANTAEALKEIYPLDTEFTALLGGAELFKTVLEEKGPGESLMVATQGLAPLPVLALLKSYKVSQDSQLLKNAVEGALLRDNVQILEFLYSSKMPIDQTLSVGMTGLQLACKQGAVKAAHWFLGQGASLLINGKGQSILEIAASEASPAMVRMLLDTLNPDINSNNNRGETLLHFAARAGRLNNVVVLLDEGADPTVSDEMGNTPLHEAVKNQHATLAHLLLCCGADLKKTNMFGQTAMDLATEDMRKQLRGFQKIPGETRMQTAVRNKNRIALELLKSKFPEERLGAYSVAIDLDDKTSCRILKFA